MLDKLHRAALFLLPVRRFCLVGVVLLAALFGSSVFGWLGEAYLIPSIVGILWLVALYSFIVSFQSLPPAPPPHARLDQRVRVGLKRALYWAIAALLLGISGALVLVSLRFIKVWYAQTAG